MSEDLSVQHVQPPATYAEVLDRHPDMPQPLVDLTTDWAVKNGEPGFELRAVEAAEALPVQNHDWEQIAADVPLSPAHEADHQVLGAELDPDYNQRSLSQQRAISVVAELGSVADRKQVVEIEADKNLADAMRGESLQEATVSEAIDQLRSENGEYPEPAARLLTESMRQQIQNEGRIPYAVDKVLAGRPELLQSLISYAGKVETNDWDKAAIKITVQQASRGLEARNVPFSWDGEAAPTTEQARLIEADKTTAEQLRAEVEVFDLPAQDLGGMITKYGRLGESGVTLRDAETYDKLRSLYGELQPTATEVLYVAQQYESAGSVTKQLLHTNQYAPDRLLRAEKYLEAAARGYESDPNAQEEAAQKVAQLLQCRANNDPEAARQARDTFTELVDGGADVRGITNLFGTAQELENYQMAVSSEASSLTKGLVVALARHPELTYGEVGSTRVIQQLVERPEDFTQAVAAIDTELAKALEAGYPPDVAAKEVEFIFSPYIYNLTQQYGDGTGNMDTLRTNYVSAHLEAMAILGAHSVELERLTSGLESRDNYVSDLAAKLHSGQQADVQELRANIADAAVRISRFAQDQPELYEAIRRQTSFGNTGKLETIQAYVAMSGQLTHRMDFLGPIAESMGADGLQVLVGSIDSTFDYSAGFFPEGVFTSLDQLQRIVTADSRLNMATLMRYMASSADGERSERVTNLLLGDSVQNLMNDAALAQEINAALPMLFIHEGQYDFSKASSLYATLPAEKGWLAEIISSEAALRQHGGEALTEKFYQLGQRILSRRDKDGSPYDSPDMLRRALGLHGAEPRYAGELDWFFAGDLPAAAANSTIYFHPQALEAGIENKPEAVYEWIHKDPNKVAELSHHYLDQYIKGALIGQAQLAPDDESAKRIVEVMDREAEAMEQDFRLFLNMSPETLVTIAEHGEGIKSMLDAGVEVDNRGSQYQYQRSGVEVALGIRSMNSDQPHPVYGTVGYVGDGVPSGAVGYGDIMLTFKPTPDILDRTSFTPEDSFHGAHRLTLQDAQILRLIKSGAGIEHTRTADYVEFQTQGGFNMADIDEIYVPNEEAATTLRQKLPEQLQAKIQIRDGAGAYAANREKSVYNSVLSETPPFTS